MQARAEGMVLGFCFYYTHYILTRSARQRCTCALLTFTSCYINVIQPS